MICKLLQLQWFYNCKKKQNVNFLLSHTVYLLLTILPGQPSQIVHSEETFNHQDARALAEFSIHIVYSYLQYNSLCHLQGVGELVELQ